MSLIRHPSLVPDELMMRAPDSRCMSSPLSAEWWHCAFMWGHILGSQGVGAVGPALSTLSPPQVPVPPPVLSAAPRPPKTQARNGRSSWLLFYLPTSPAASDSNSVSSKPDPHLLLPSLSSSPSHSPIPWSPIPPYSAHGFPVAPPATSPGSQTHVLRTQM